MIMFERDENNIHEEIVTLQRDFILACRELSKLRALSDDKHSELGTTSTQLKSAAKDSRIGDKTIRNAENEIALFRKKISEMGSDLDSVDRELKGTNDEFEELSAKRNELMEDLAGIEAELRQTMVEVAESEEESQGILSAIEKLSTKKAGLSAEISEMLSNQSIAKIQETEDLDEFSLNFGRLAMERENIKGIFAKREEALSGVRDKILLLKQKCSSIEEVIELEKKQELLKTDVRKLEEEGQTGNQKTKGLQESLSDKEKELKRISSEKIEKKGLIEPLENEVGVFDDMVVKVQNSETRLGESDSLVDEAISHVKGLFAEGMRQDLGIEESKN